MASGVSNNTLYTGSPPTHSTSQSGNPPAVSSSPYSTAQNRDGNFTDPITSCEIATAADLVFEIQKIADLDTFITITSGVEFRSNPLISSVEAMSNFLIDQVKADISLANQPIAGVINSRQLDGTVKRLIVKMTSGMDLEVFDFSDVNEVDLAGYLQNNSECGFADFRDNLIKLIKHNETYAVRIFGLTDHVIRETGSKRESLIDSMSFLQTGPGETFQLDVDKTFVCTSCLKIDKWYFDLGATAFDRDGDIKETTAAFNQNNDNAKHSGDRDYKTFVDGKEYLNHTVSLKPEDNLFVFGSADYKREGLIKYKDKLPGMFVVTKAFIDESVYHPPLVRFVQLELSEKALGDSTFALPLVARVTSEKVVFKVLYQPIKGKGASYFGKRINGELETQSIEAAKYAKGLVFEMPVSSILGGGAAESPPLTTTSNLNAGGARLDVSRTDSETVNLSTAQLESYLGRPNQDEGISKNNTVVCLLPGCSDRTRESLPVESFVEVGQRVSVVKKDSPQLLKNPSSTLGLMGLAPAIPRRGLSACIAEDSGQDRASIVKSMKGKMPVYFVPEAQTKASSIQNMKIADPNEKARFNGIHVIELKGVLTAENAFGQNLTIRLEQAKVGLTSAQRGPLSAMVFLVTYRHPKDQSIKQKYIFGDGQTALLMPEGEVENKIKFNSDVTTKMEAILKGQGRITFDSLLSARTPRPEVVINGKRLNLLGAGEGSLYEYVLSVPANEFIGPRAWEIRDIIAQIRLLPPTTARSEVQSLLSKAFKAKRDQLNDLAEREFTSGSNKEPLAKQYEKIEKQYKQLLSQIKDLSYTGVNQTFRQNLPQKGSQEGESGGGAASTGRKVETSIWRPLYNTVVPPQAVAPITTLQTPVTPPQKLTPPTQEELASESTPQVAGVPVPNTEVVENVAIPTGSIREQAAYRLRQKVGGLKEMPLKRVEESLRESAVTKFVNVRIPSVASLLKAVTSEDMEMAMVSGIGTTEGCAFKPSELTMTEFREGCVVEVDPKTEAILTNSIFRSTATVDGFCDVKLPLYKMDTPLQANDFFAEKPLDLDSPSAQFRAGILMEIRDGLSTQMGGKDQLAGKKLDQINSLIGLSLFKQISEENTAEVNQLLYREALGFISMGYSVPAIPVHKLLQDETYFKKSNLDEVFKSKMGLIVADQLMTHAKWAGENFKDGRQLQKNLQRVVVSSIAKAVKVGESAEHLINNHDAFMNNKGLCAAVKGVADSRQCIPEGGGAAAESSGTAVSTSVSVPDLYPCVIEPYKELLQTWDTIKKLLNDRIPGAKSGPDLLSSLIEKYNHFQDQLKGTLKLSEGDHHGKLRKNINREINRALIAKMQEVLQKRYPTLKLWIFDNKIVLDDDVRKALKSSDKVIERMPDLFISDQGIASLCNSKTTLKTPKFWVSKGATGWKEISDSDELKVAKALDDQIKKVKESSQKIESSAEQQDEIRFAIVNHNKDDKDDKSGPGELVCNVAGVKRRLKAVVLHSVDQMQAYSDLRTQMTEKYVKKLRCHVVGDFKPVKLPFRIINPHNYPVHKFVWKHLSGQEGECPAHIERLISSTGIDEDIFKVLSCEFEQKVAESVEAAATATFASLQEELVSGTDINRRKSLISRMEIKQVSDYLLSQQGGLSGGENLENLLGIISVLQNVRCPITLRPITKDAILFSKDGHTYSNAGLKRWYESEKLKRESAVALGKAPGPWLSPSTGEEISEPVESDFISNYTYNKIINCKKEVETALKTQQNEPEKVDAIIKLRDNQVLDVELLAEAEATLEHEDKSKLATQIDELENPFLCSISGTLLEDPVIASDGHTYSRALITKWWQCQQTQGLPFTSPLTGAVMENNNLIVNAAVVNLIEATAPKIEAAVAAVDK